MENWIIKARKDLDLIIGNLSLNDWRNRPNKRKRGYSLGYETLEAIEIKKLTVGKVSKENEKKIKAYLIPIRVNRPELLKEI